MFELTSILRGSLQEFLAGFAAGAKSLVDDVGDARLPVVVQEPEVVLVVRGPVIVEVFVTLLIDLVGAGFLPHLGLIGANDGGVDSEWVPGRSGRPACISALVHPVSVGPSDGVAVIGASVVVKVSASAHVASVDLEVFSNRVWELLLNLLGSSIAIVGVSEVAISTTEIIEAIHIINSFDLLFEKIRVVSQKVADVHWESNRGNSHRLVWLGPEHIYVDVLHITNIARVPDATVGV